MTEFNNVIRIPTSINGNFFKYWVEFLRPFHKLTKTEMNILTCFIKHRYELSRVIKNNEILDKVTISTDTQKKIRTECNISASHFQVIFGKLKKTNIIINNRLNPKFIPTIKEENGTFKLLFIFELK